MLIATAGHIDHGKTSLIRALTGVETDRLPEEKARGISIDLGFAYWRPDGGPTIGFVDVPGHERFVRNMIAGLSGIGFALLVVAADDGVMPQTVEHLQILQSLGIVRGAVALTKIDRVEPERVVDVKAELATLLVSTALAQAPVFAVSSATGAGIADLAAALIAERTTQASDATHGFRLAVDRAFSVTGAGTVVTGTVAAGSAAVGDVLVLSPIGHEVRVRGVQSGGRKVEAISVGERCALNLTGVEVADIHRGDWLVTPAGHGPTLRMEAEVFVLAGRDGPLRHDIQVHMHHGAATLGARVLTPRQRALAPGTGAVVQIILDRPTSAVTGDRFVLRDQSGRELVGSGRVLDPLPTTRRRSLSEREARAAALALPNPAARLASLAATAGIEPDIQWFRKTANLTTEALDTILSDGGFIRAGKAATIAIGAERYTELGQALVATVTRHHADHPNEGGMARRLVRAALPELVSADLCASLLRDLVGAKVIEADGALLRIPGHSASFSPVEVEFWRKALAALEGQPPKPIVLVELARELRSSEAAVRALLLRRKTSGDVWQVNENKFMLRQHVARLVALGAELDQVSNGGFKAADFRDASGIGRNFVIQLLEFFDRIGVTRRIGEARRMRGDWESVVGAARPWRRP